MINVVLTFEVPFHYLNFMDCCITKNIYLIMCAECLNNTVLVCAVRKGNYSSHPGNTKPCLQHEATLSVQFFTC